MSYGL